MAKVLIHGLDGLGAEIAKNLVLTAGVKYTLTLSAVTPVWNFKVLGEALGEFDDLQVLDETKSDETPFLHLAFQALHRFLMLFDRYPRAGSKKDTERFIALVKKMNNEIGSRFKRIDVKLLTKLAYGAEAILSPMSLIFSGLVGKQVLKAL
ncbi:hypothetical protein C2S52_013587 [Perilla frutescens var. hirtella]|nr:hypothetical protein C2S51_015872 [Perilla frutescens var. frutescens]KAH6776026.1 hypothetical protein C2S52_013587 [Perilla frutescens var. hirtella]